METPIPQFYKRPSGCTLDNVKALEAVHRIIDWYDLETPARLAFALNYVYAELSVRDEIPHGVNSALNVVSFFLENLQDALSMGKGTEEKADAEQLTETLKELAQVRKEHFELLKQHQELLEQQRQFPRTNKN